MPGCVRSRDLHERTTLLRADPNRQPYPFTSSGQSFSIRPMRPGARTMAPKPSIIVESIAQPRKKNNTPKTSERGIQTAFISKRIIPSHRHHILRSRRLIRPILNLHNHRAALQGPNGMPLADGNIQPHHRAARRQLD